ncbi:MAG: sensor histidine kinase [Bacillota bacterium]
MKFSMRGNILGLMGRCFGSFFRIKNLSLKYKLIIFLMMLCTIPILILGSISYNITSRIMMERVVEDSNQFIVNKLQSIDNTFGEIENMVFDFVTSNDTQVFLKYIDKSNFETYSSYQILAHLESKADYILSLKSDIISSIIILPRKGGYPFFRGNLTIDYYDDFSQLDVYRITTRNKDKVLWTVSYGPEREITVSRTIGDVSSGDVIGVLVIYLNAQFINDMTSSMPVEKGEYIFLLDEQNRIISHPDPAMIGTALKDDRLINEIRNMKTGSFSATINEVPSIVTLRTSNVNDWKIAHVIPYSNIIGDIRNLSWATVVIAFACMLYSVLISLLIFRYIYRPLNKLVGVMDEIAGGNLDIKIDSNRKDEFGKITDTFNYMVFQVKKLILKIEEEQKKIRENEIKALQAQIMPHFLYNTLNAVKALARMGRNEDIIDMVVAFIRLLRVSMDYGHDFIPIYQELDYIKSYIRIMQYRYDIDFVLNLEADEDVKHCGVLKFMIQPIVENCIVHAFEGRNEDCVITIRIFDHNGNVRFIVSDNGVGMDENTMQNLFQKETDSSRIKFSRIGIRNVDERIKLTFGKQYGIRYESHVGKGTSVYIDIPRFTVK